jgi:pyruvate-formate lyase
MSEIPMWAQLEILKREIAIAEKKAEMRQKLQENADYQRLNGMTQTQRGANAVELMTKKRLEFERSIRGVNVSEEEIRRKVLAMQNKFERDRGK